MANDLKLGQIIEGPQQRDAIHVAVAPVTAAQILSPGEHVGFVDDEREKVGRAARKLGIVDPYLTTPVFPGQRFWLFLYPQTITSLRHDWTHPAFEAAPGDALGPSAASEQWLREFAEQAELSYGSVMLAAAEYLTTGDVYVQHGEESARSAFYKAGPETFWKHYEIVTGTKVADHTGHVFCCSC